MHSAKLLYELYVYDKAKKIIDFNHISNQLTESDIDEHKAYYKTYHRKCWAYKQATKRYKRWKILGTSSSVIFASGGIASTIATSGISLIAISTATLLIQGYMKHKQLDLKIQNCTYAYQCHQHLLISIKDAMRCGSNDYSHIHAIMNNIDNYVTDNSPVVDKFTKKYYVKFTD